MKPAAPEESAGLNVHIYPAPFMEQTRVFKITRSLVESGIFPRIVIYGVGGGEEAGAQKLDARRDLYLISRSLDNKKSSLLFKVANTIEWSYKIIQNIRGRKVTCINCHSLAVLPLCVYLKKKTHATLIYDTHELETETDGVGGIRKALMKIAERGLIKYADAVSVVSDSIADWYRQEYGLSEVTVVRNIPYKVSVDFRKKPYFRNYFSIPPQHTIFLYQGLISFQRGVQLLLKVFSQLEPSKHLVFMGAGDALDTVLAYADQHENIHYHPAVPPAELPQYTCGADVGVHLIEDTCLNHRYCLPNKIWEYLSVGLPVVVSDLPEMAKVVQELNCGWTVRPDEKSAVELFQQLTAAEIASGKANVMRRGNLFSWEKEEKQLLAMYHGLGYLKATIC
jgi:glycosyltransferase involved in cell wall biosynthesis